MYYWDIETLARKHSARYYTIRVGMQIDRFVRIVRAITGPGQARADYMIRLVQVSLGFDRGIRLYAIDAQPFDIVQQARIVHVAPSSLAIKMPTLLIANRATSIVSARQRRST